MKHIFYAAEIDTKKILALQKVECDRGRGGVTSRSNMMEPGAYQETSVQISCQLIIHLYRVGWAVEQSNSAHFSIL